MVEKVQGFREVLETIAILLQSELKKAAPAVSGRLRQSIKVRVASDGTLEIFMVDYWKNVEFGTNPHTVDPDDLKKWAKRKLGNEDLAYKVAERIRLFGTRPNPFIRNTLNTKLPNIIEQIIK